MLGMERPFGLGQPWDDLLERGLARLEQENVLPSLRAAAILGSVAAQTAESDSDLGILLVATKPLDWGVTGDLLGWTPRS